MFIYMYMYNVVLAHTCTFRIYMYMYLLICIVHNVVYSIWFMEYILWVRYVIIFLH